MAEVLELSPPPDDFDVSEVESFIQEIDDEPVNLSMLVYGKSGVGKTRFGATGENVLIINCNEQKPISIRGMGARVVTITKVPDDLDKIFWYLNMYGHKKYHTVVIDSLSSLQKMYERKVVADECALNPGKHKIIVTQRDYGIVNNYMYMHIVNYRNLQNVMNVIFIALERGPDEDNDLYRPDITPGTQRAVESAVNVIGRMYLKDVTIKGKDLTVPTLYVGPNSEAVTKDCTGKLKPEILAPKIPKILEMIEGGKK